MNGVYGPQTDEVIRLIATAMELTREQCTALNSAGYAARKDARDAAGTAAGTAERVAAWDDARAAAWHASYDVAWGAPWSAPLHAARYAVLDAVAALVVRHLIRPDGPFTLAHYNLLTGPWRQVIGKVHPNDEIMSERCPYCHQTVTAHPIERRCKRCTEIFLVLTDKSRKRFCSRQCQVREYTKNRYTKETGS